MNNKISAMPENLCKINISKEPIQQSLAIEKKLQCKILQTRIGAHQKDLSFELVKALSIPVDQSRFINFHLTSQSRRHKLPGIYQIMPSHHENCIELPLPFFSVARDADALDLKKRQEITQLYNVKNNFKERKRSFFYEILKEIY